MFVCICNAITDHQIKETVAAGASTSFLSAAGGQQGNTAAQGIRVSG